MELSDVQKQTHLEKKSFVYSYVFHCFLSFPEMIFYAFFHAPFFFRSSKKIIDRPKKMKSMMASPALGLESWCIGVMMIGLQVERVEPPWWCNETTSLQQSPCIFQLLIRICFPVGSLP